MKRSYPKEISVNTPEKKVDQTRSRELNKYPEKVEYRNLSRNKQLEKKFSEKHSRSLKRTDEDRQKRSEIVEDMVNKRFPVSSDKQRDNTADFHYADKNEFEKELRQRDPAGTDRNIDLTQGFYDSEDRQAFVKDHGNTLVTSLHEKLHQKSNSELPTRLNEGITEHYARQGAGAMGILRKFDRHGNEISKPLSDYEKEVQLVSKMEAIIGKEPIRRAYFDGDTRNLEMRFDSALGQGAFKQLNDALEKRDYDKASEIMKSGEIGFFSKSLIRKRFLH